MLFLHTDNESQLFNFGFYGFFQKMVTQITI